jgi:hypothetical protein
VSRGRACVVCPAGGQRAGAGAGAWRGLSVLVRGLLAAPGSPSPVPSASLSDRGSRRLISGTASPFGRIVSKLALPAWFDLALSSKRGAKRGGSVAEVGVGVRVRSLPRIVRASNSTSRGPLHFAVI